MDETGDSYYRMRWPARDLVFQAPGWRVLNLDARAEERFSWGEAADLLIIYQSNDPDLLPLMEKRKRAGRKTLVEYNDNYYDVQPWSPVSDAWQSPLLWQRYELMMKVSDGVIVTGEGLRDVLSSHVHQRFFILENNLPKPPESFETLRQKKTPYPSVGWGGSLGHIADFLSVLPVVKSILAWNPDVKFHVMGNETIPSLLDIPRERIVFRNWGTMEEYFEFWEEIHIGIAPLLDTPYNRCRSDIKAVEMSSRGVLPILSNSLPYRNFLELTDSEPFESFEDLVSLLRDYISQPAEREERARVCHRYVSERRVGLKRTERLALYEEMLGGTSPSDFRWPMGPGYYEVLGTPSPQLAQQSVFNEVNAQYRQGRTDAALQMIESFCGDNHLNADASLVRLKCLRGMKRPDFAQQLQEASFRFPDDMRFPLLGIEASADETEIIERWKGLFKRLSSMPRQHALCFEDEIISLFIRQMLKYKSLLELRSHILAFYPHASRLHYELGEALRKLGRDKEALEHFSRLSDMKRSYQENKAFLEGIDLKYIEAWKSVLKARTS